MFVLFPAEGEQNRTEEISEARLVALLNLPVPPEDTFSRMFAANSLALLGERLQ